MMSPVAYCIRCQLSLVENSQSPFTLLREVIGDARLNHFNKIIISEILTEVKFSNLIFYLKNSLSHFTRPTVTAAGVGRLETAMACFREIAERAKRDRPNTERKDFVSLSQPYIYIISEIFGNVKI